ncbi:hypothetical protein [Streptomyces vietnamensis]
MTATLIIDRLRRGTDEIKPSVELVPFDNMTLEELVDYIYANRFDGLVVDHKLKSSNPDIDFEGTDIALSMENLIHFYPLFILTSHPNDAESERYTDVNIVYEKGNYIADTTGLIVEHINKKILTQIEHFKNRLADAESELETLRNKANKTDEEKDRFIELDHLIETSLCGRHVMPKNLKNQSEDIQELLGLARKIYKMSEEE